MLEQTMDRLNQLKLHGMASELERQIQLPDSAGLSFEERFSLIVDMEATSRENRRLGRLLRGARLREAALIEDIDFRASRGLERSVVITLGACDWIRQHHNLIVTGPTGAGKTFVACALANSALRQGLPAVYYRSPRLLSELGGARADGSYAKLLRKLAKTELLVIDDWGLNALSETERRDILEVVEDRYKLRSTIVVSQIPVDRWHETIGSPTIADAILDRLIHNAYKITLKGGSMRKSMSDLTHSVQL